MILLPNNSSGNEANTSFPNYSPNSKPIVHRVFGKEYGLHIIHFASRSVHILVDGITDVYENTPMCSPDGERSGFLRCRSYTDFDTATI
jgi:hypothetical protein